jgi:hypothetical protein
LRWLKARGPKSPTARLLYVVLSCCLASSALAAVAVDIRESMAAFDRGEYLSAVQALRDGALRPSGEVRDRALFQIWRQSRVFVGVDGVCSTAPDVAGSVTTPDPAWRARVSQASRRDAIATILERARATDVVILNESHENSRGRAFGLELARALRPLGYSLLAVEALRNDRKGGSPPAGPPIENGALPLDAGFYTKDPVFADMIVQARRAGYRIAAYEHVPSDGTGGSPADREEGQARNLSGIISLEPKSKLLVFAGHSHVAEAPLPGRGGAATEWMAARLKRMTGVDPLTIDQASLDETSTSGSARGAHRIASDGLGPRSAILFEKGSPLVYGQYSGVVDLQVVHRQTTCISGRPDWLSGLGRRPKAIPRSLLPLSGRRLVQAFAKDAPSNSVPLDQVIVEAARPAPVLMLPDLPVRYRVQD